MPAQATTSNNNSVYDLIVIGSGPAGQKAAICAAKLRKKVAVVERKRTIGGVCVHTGTIPSKTFREAILYLSGLRQRTFYGRASASLSHHMPDMSAREWAAALPLVLLMFWMGIYSQSFMPAISTQNAQMLQQVNRTTNAFQAPAVKEVANAR